MKYDSWQYKLWNFWWLATRPFRKLWYSIENLIRWFPIIWNDRNWDHYYFYKILQFKLKRMKHQFTHHSNHVGADKSAHKMGICIQLLERITNSNYVDAEFEKHFKKWGEFQFRNVELNGNHYKELCDPVNVKTAKDKKQHDDEVKRLSKKEGKMLEQDLDLLFTILRKNIQTWWD